MGGYKDKLAFLATARSLIDATKRLAIFVGIRADDTTNPRAWRSRLIAGDDLENAMSENPLWEAAPLFDLPQDESLIGDWLKGAQTIGVSDGAGSAMEPVVGPSTGAKKNGSIWLGGLTRVNLFRGDSEMAGPNPLTPVVGYDIAGSATWSMSPLPAATWAVSRARLDAVSPWIKADGQFDLTRTLAASRSICHIPVALGAHDRLETTAGRAKRYDTRTILVAHADRGKQSRSFTNNDVLRLCAVRVRSTGDSAPPKVNDSPQTVGSSVTLGLALPTSWTQSGAVGLPSYAFPFRVRYEPGRFTGAQAIATDLTGVMQGRDQDQLYRFSRHLVGLAFDVSANRRHHDSLCDARAPRDRQRTRSRRRPFAAARPVQQAA